MEKFTAVFERDEQGVTNRDIASVPAQAYSETRVCATPRPENLSVHI